MSWLAGPPADCTVFGLVAPWLGPAERSSPAAAQRCAAGAGLDGAGQGQASLPPSRTTTRSDTVWLLKSRLLHLTLPMAQLMPPVTEAEATQIAPGLPDQ